MKFEKDSRNRRTAIFEVDARDNLHQQHIAVSALGMLTMAHRDKDQRTLSAQLGVRLAQAPTSAEVEGETKSQETRAALSFKEAGILQVALIDYVTFTPEGIQQALMMRGPHAANVRAVETDIISVAMLPPLQEEFRLAAPSTPPPFGFR